jgi:hypothetical protein
VLDQVKQPGLLLTVRIHGSSEPQPAVVGDPLQAGSGPTIGDQSGRSQAHELGLSPCVGAPSDEVAITADSPDEHALSNPVPAANQATTSEPRWCRLEQERCFMIAA